MKYTISIDQVHAKEWGLSFSEAAVFSFCNELSTWADPIVIDGQVWYFASRNKVIEELSWITDRPDTVYRIYKALNEKGVIRWQKQGEKDCVQITAKGKQWNSEKFPRAGKKSEGTRKNFRISPEKNPTNNNTIDYNTIDKRENAPAKNSEPLFVTCQKHIIEQLAGDYANILRGARQRSKYSGPVDSIILDYCRNVAEGTINGKGDFHLMPPTDEGKHYTWLNRMMAGIERYMAAAARRGSDMPKIKAPRPAPALQRIKRATVADAQKILQR